MFVTRLWCGCAGLALGGRIGCVFDGAEAGEEGADAGDLVGVGLVVEELEERVEGALVGVEDGLVVRLDRGCVHKDPLRRLLWPWRSISHTFGLCKVNERNLFGYFLLEWRQE